MKRAQLRWSRPGIPVNASLFLVGLALILGATVGVGVSGVKVPVLGSWWIRGLLVALGVVILVFSFFATEPPASPSGNEGRRPLPPLPALVPGTAFIGYVPDVPSRYVARADIFDTARNDVLSHATVALAGMGGAGKTTLAAAIAHDPTVQAAFPDGIAWVDTGPQATSTQLQERLATRLTGEPASFPTAEVGRHRLAELLAGRAFLLVIDDIWDADVINALNVVGAPRGALLFTTRDRSIARAVGATVREVDELALEQALALLGRWTDIGFDRLPPIADRLCMQVGNLALGVALVGGMIKARGARPQDWQDVMDLLDNADVDAIADAYGPDSYQHASVLASITLSIDDLPPADQACYRELAVFSGRGSIPPSAVSVLWASGCTVADPGGLVARLTDRSLAQRDTRGWITLHDLQYDVATRQLAASPGGLARAHGHLLDGYRSQLPHAVTVGNIHGQDDPSVWVSGPDDGYLFQNLAFHLARAGRSKQLAGLLVSFPWLERKLAVAGISDLLADYSQQQPRPADVEAVHGALQLSAHVLARDPGLLASQLVGRLLGQSDPGISALVDTARPSDGHPWLRPRTPGSLTEPGGPLERILQGHAGPVRAVAVTADGRVVSGGDDNTVRVWDLANGRLERTMACPSSVHAVAVTADGRIVSGGLHRVVAVWNLASGRLERTLEDDRYSTNAVAVTADGHIVSGGNEGTVRVWDLPSGRLEHTLEGHTGWITAVAVTADGQRIISGDHEGNVRVWDLPSGRLEHTLKSWTARPEAMALAVTPDGRRIIIGIGYQKLEVWDLASGRREHTVEGHFGMPKAVAVTPDGRRIVSGGEPQVANSNQGTVQVLDLASGRLERTLEGHTGCVRALAVTSDGQRLVSGSEDGTVRVWDLASGRQEHPLKGHIGQVMRVLNLATGRQEHTLQGRNDKIYALAVTPDGQRIVSGSDHGAVQVRDLASGHLERTLKGDTYVADDVRTLAVTPDSQRIISASGHIMQVWNLASRRLERTQKGDISDDVRTLAVTADSQRIISISKGISSGAKATARVWDLASGRLEQTLEDTGTVAVTPDSQRIISASGHIMQVWNLASGRLERTLEGHTGVVRAVAVTPDGRRIITGSMGTVSGAEDGTVQVWDLASGHLERTLDDTGGGYAITVTPDGQRIISRNRSAPPHPAPPRTTVRVWDLASGRLEHTLEDTGAGYVALAVTPDGQRIIFGGGDGTVQVWDLATGTELAHWVTDTTPVLNCASHPQDPDTLVYSDAAGRVVVLSLRGPDPAIGTPTP